MELHVETDSLLVEESGPQMFFEEQEFVSRFGRLGYRSFKLAVPMS